MQRRTPLLIAAAVAVCACAAPTASESPLAVPGAVPTAAEDVPGPRVSILARDELGRPLSGADVWIVSDATLRVPEALVASRTTGDVVETLRALGTASGTTDRDGRVELAAPAAASLLVAIERDAWFGQVEVPTERALARGITVTAAARVEQAVLVLDAAGEALAGVPVSAAVRDRRGRLEHLPATAFTDARGQAVVRVPEGSFGGSTALVVARVATTEPVTAPWEGTGVAQLRLPPAASLALALPAAYANAYSGLVQVFAASEGSRSSSTLACSLGGASAHVQPVEAGVDLRAIALVRDGADGSLLGRHEWSVSAADASAGSAVEIPLAETVMLTGRILGEGGAPLASEPIQLGIAGQPRWIWTSSTDEDGRFRWLLPRRVAEGGRLEASWAGGRATSGSELPDALGPDFDAGDVR